MLMPKVLLGLSVLMEVEKSTLLKNIYRVLKPDQGVILLKDEFLNQMNYKKSSQLMSVVGQEHEIAF